MGEIYRINFAVKLNEQKFIGLGGWDKYLFKADFKQDNDRVHWDLIISSLDIAKINFTVKVCYGSPFI